MYEVLNYRPVGENRASLLMATPYTLLSTLLLCSIGQLLLLPGAQAKQGELELYEPDFGDYNFPIRWVWSVSL